VNEVVSYDVAVSFDEGQRSVVEEVVEACRERGLTVLDGAEHTHEWWARKSAGDLPAARVWFFLPLVSAVDEFTTAVLRAVRAGDQHVLPVLVGDVTVPADLLHPHVAYLHTGNQLAEALAGRVEQAEAAGWERARLAEVVTAALEPEQEQVPASVALSVEPSVEPVATSVPATFSRYAEQDAVMRYLGEQFVAAAPALGRRGFVGTVHRGDTRIALRVERAGDTVYALDIQRGGIGGDETVNFVVGLHDAASACTNGWARPVYDAGAGAARLELHDRSVFGSRDPEPRLLTAEELFAALWQRIDTVLTATVA
jgi:hypothetical protein